MNRCAESFSIPDFPEDHSKIPASTPYGNRLKAAISDNNVLCESQDSGFSSQTSIHDASSIDEVPIRIIPLTNSSNQHDDPIDCLPTDGKHKMLKYFEKINKNYPIENQIGRRMGEKHIDLIAGLWDRKIPCLEGILKSLGPRELRRCAQVCLKWRSIIKAHKLIEVRLLKAGKNRQAEKENPSPEKDDQTSGPLVAVAPFRVNINRQLSEISDRSNDASNYDRFHNAALKLTAEERLMKCVKCLGPAKVVKSQQRALCSTEHCGFDFCTLCELTYHKSSKCKVSKPSATKPRELVTIGSKKSKARLRRL